MDYIATLNLPVFATYPYACIKPYVYSVSSTNNQSISQFLQVDNTNGLMTISSSDFTQIGSYSLQMIANEPIGGAKSLPLFFTLKLDCRVTSVDQVFK